VWHGTEEGQTTLIEIKEAHDKPQGQRMRPEVSVTEIILLR